MFCNSYLGLFHQCSCTSNVLRYNSKKQTNMDINNVGFKLKCLWMLNDVWMNCSHQICQTARIHTKNLNLKETTTRQKYCSIMNTLLTFCFSPCKCSCNISWPHAVISQCLSLEWRQSKKTGSSAPSTCQHGSLRLFDIEMMKHVPPFSSLWL